MFMFYGGFISMSSKEIGGEQCEELYTSLEGSWHQTTKPPGQHQIPTNSISQSAIKTKPPTVPLCPVTPPHCHRCRKGRRKHSEWFFLSIFFVAEDDCVHGLWWNRHHFTTCVAGLYWHNLGLLLRLQLGLVGCCVHPRTFLLWRWRIMWPSPKRRRTVPSWNHGRDMVYNTYQLLASAAQTPPKPSQKTLLNGEESPIFLIEIWLFHFQEQLETFASISTY